MQRKAIDFTLVKEVNPGERVKTILTCFVKVDEETLLKTLLNDCIMINGKYYEIPRERILDLLKSKDYGVQKFHLIELEPKEPRCKVVFSD